MTHERTGFATDIPSGYTIRTHNDQSYAQYPNGDRIKLLNPFVEAKKDLSGFYTENRELCDTLSKGDNFGKFYMYVIQSFIKKQEPLR